MTKQRSLWQLHSICLSGYWILRWWSFASAVPNWNSSLMFPVFIGRWWLWSTIWAMSWENLFYAYANNKGADQPVHPHSLISTFVVRCLDSIYNTSSFYIRNFKTLASFCGCAGRFVSYLVANPEGRFSCDAAHLVWCEIVSPETVASFVFFVNNVAVRYSDMCDLRYWLDQHLGTKGFPNTFVCLGPSTS